MAMSIAKTQGKQEEGGLGGLGGGGGGGATGGGYEWNDESDGAGEGGRESNFSENTSLDSGSSLPRRLSQHGRLGYTTGACTLHDTSPPSVPLLLREVCPDTTKTTMTS